MTDKDQAPDRRRSPSMSDADRDSIVSGVAEILLNSEISNPLTDDERLWVRNAIKAQAKRADFMDAVIKKSVGSLIWGLFIGLGYLALDWLKSHGFRTN